jgi:hypothetical protein
MDTHGLYDIVITLPAAKSLPLSRRQNIQHVTLEEDRAAVALPERHAEGLISLCVRSPNLPVERRVGPLRNILPGGNLAIRAGCIYGYLYLADMITWMKEAQELFARGMPRGSYCVIIDVEAEECESAWKLLERAAALQDAMVNAARVSAIRPSPNAPPLAPSWTGPTSCHGTYVAISQERFGKSYRELLSYDFQMLLPLLEKSGTKTHSTTQPWTGRWRNGILSGTRL